MRASLHWGAPGRAVAHLGAVRLHRPRAPSPRALLHVVSPTLLLRLKTSVLLPAVRAQGHISAKLCTHHIMNLLDFEFSIKICCVYHVMLI